jgi:hypothetical protein
MGLLGKAVGAPVPEVAVIDLPDALIQNQPDLKGLPAGLAHGSRYVPGASSVKQGILHETLGGNRSRYSALSIMYGWAGVFSDHQFFYEDTTNLVLSFDHGNFFPGGPNWTAANLRAAAQAEPDQQITTKCHLTKDELSAAVLLLNVVTTATIASAVSAPPNSWGLTLDDRVEVATYLEKRKEQLLAS